ncbi:uncharacterized protein At2g33490-like isoform X2 [Durio zibethinus]|uniref:Uncharacterized protein At2g33490-like isoform X2 n=1 Tax=Durio zibethinus TaxID=66656 RepID=A0A6P5ZD91_DURZI|nr:uncharacterized protein At2g33490-like isoform X2 [Durio zibethinus]
MKSSFDKFKRFALHKNDGEDKLHFLSSAHFDELAQAAQEMQDMRNCYDSLLSAAAATANSAYEFSESLQEMGSCLQEKIVLPNDEESRRILLMLGNLQFELQKLVDNYRSHILLTITNPSESLLNELRTVEDMKWQCDEKRNVYENIVTQQKEKGRSKGRKGQTFTLQQLQTARDEYDDVATHCVFRSKSLKQGQSRSLLTQAARHYAAQLNFFRKGLKSLEAIEPHVKQVTEQQHIDYLFSGLEDDDGEDGEIAYEPNEDGELSFDYRANDKGVDVTSASRNSMEVDEVSLSFLQTLKKENAEVNPEKSHGNSQVSSREHRVGSHSAPIFPERKLDPDERVKQMLQSSTGRSSTYVLPTPNDSKFAVSSRTISPITHTRPKNVAGRAHNLSHSSPLEQKKHEKDSGGGQLSVFSHLPISQPLSPPKGSPNASPRLVSSPRISELHELPRPPGSSVAKPAKSPAMVGHSAPLFSRNQELSASNIPSLETSGASPLPTPPLIVPRSFSIPSSNQRAMAIHVSRLLEAPQVPDKDGEVTTPLVTPISLVNTKKIPGVSEAASHSGQIRGGS